MFVTVRNVKIEDIVLFPLQVLLMKKTETKVKGLIQSLS